MLKKLFKKNYGWIELTLENGQKFLVNIRYILFEEFESKLSPNCHSRITYPDTKEFVNVRETNEIIEEKIRRS